MYKAINKELSAKNQELRIAIRDLKTEIVMLNTQKMEEHEKSQLLKKSVKQMLIKNYNEILNILLPDEQQNIVELNKNYITQQSEQNQLNFLSETKSSEKRSLSCVSRRQSFTNCLTEDPLRDTKNGDCSIIVQKNQSIDSNSSNENKNEGNQRDLINKKRRRIENSASPSPESLSTNDDSTSSSADIIYCSNSSNDEINSNTEKDLSENTSSPENSMRYIPSKSENEMNRELPTIVEEDSIGNIRTVIGNCQDTAENISIELSRKHLPTNKLQIPNHIESFLSRSNEKSCNLEDTSLLGSSEPIGMQINDSVDANSDRFTFFQTLSDSRIMGLTQAPCSTPFKTLHNETAVSNVPSSNSSLYNEVTVKKLRVRLPRMDFNKLQNSQDMKTYNIDDALKTDSISNKTNQTIEIIKTSKKTKKNLTDKENNYRSESEMSISSSRPKRRVASNKSLIEPSLRTKMRRH